MKTGCTSTPTANSPADRSRSVALWGCICICLCLYFLFSDLRGISTDEGIRLLAMNGNRLFSTEYWGTPATTKEVLETVSVHTGYQPMFFIIENWVMRIAQSRDLVLLRTVNILTIAACIIVSLQMTRDWPFAPRLFLILTTYFSSGMFMHVLQVREYSLGFLFLAAVYFAAERLMRRDTRRFAIDIVPYGALGLLIGLATLNSFWIAPASSGACAVLVLTSTKRWATLARVVVTAVVVGCIVGATHLELGLDGKIDVGIWEGNATYARFAGGVVAGLSSASLGYFPRFGSIQFFAGGVISVVLIVFGATLLVRQTRDGRSCDVMERHCALSVAMILSLLAFQLFYFVVRRDALAIWSRYFFQHLWLLHILAAATLGVLYGWWKEQGARKQLYLGCLTTILVIGAACLAKGGPLAYRDSPYDDTGLTRGCEWRSLAPLVRDLSDSDPIVFSRLLEAGTITFSANFSNRMYIWDDLPVDAKQWPASFLLVDFRGLFTQEQIATRNAAIKNAGYRDAGSNVLVPRAGRDCNLAALTTRFVRAGS